MTYTYNHTIIETSNIQQQSSLNIIMDHEGCGLISGSGSIHFCIKDSKNIISLLYPEQSAASGAKQNFFKYVKFFRLCTSWEEDQYGIVLKMQWNARTPKEKMSDFVVKCLWVNFQGKLKGNVQPGLQSFPQIFSLQDQPKSIKCEIQLDETSTLPGLKSICTTQYSLMSLNACRTLMRTQILELKDKASFFLTKNEARVSQLLIKFIISILLYLNVGLLYTKQRRRNGDSASLKSLRIFISCSLFFFAHFAFMFYRGIFIPTAFVYYFAAKVRLLWFQFGFVREFAQIKRSLESFILLVAPRYPVSRAQLLSCSTLISLKMKLLSLLFPILGTFKCTLMFNVSSSVTSKMQGLANLLGNRCMYISVDSSPKPDQTSPYSLLNNSLSYGFSNRAAGDKLKLFHNSTILKQQYLQILLSIFYSVLNSLTLLVRSCKYQLYMVGNLLTRVRSIVNILLKCAWNGTSQHNRSWYKFVAGVTVNIFLPISYPEYWSMARQNEHDLIFFFSSSTSRIIIILRHLVQQFINSPPDLNTNLEEYNDLFLSIWIFWMTVGKFFHNSISRSISHFSFRDQKYFIDSARWAQLFRQWLKFWQFIWLRLGRCSQQELSGQLYNISIICDIFYFFIIVVAKDMAN